MIGIRFLLLPVVLASVLGAVATTGPNSPEDLMKSGNYQEAYDQLAVRLKAPDAKPVELQQAIACLNQLNRPNETDALLEAAIAQHGGRAEMLLQAATEYLQLVQHGAVVAGKFKRGNPDGAGNVVNSHRRDEVRSVQLLLKALPLANAELRPRVLEKLSNALDKRGGLAWRLQQKTDFTVLPDFDEGWGYEGDQTAAPVNAENRPVFYATPQSWDAAQNDGEHGAGCFHNLPLSRKRRSGTPRRKLGPTFAARNLVSNRCNSSASCRAMVAPKRPPAASWRSRLSKMKKPPRGSPRECSGSRCPMNTTRSKSMPLCTPPPKRPAMRRRAKTQRPRWPTCIATAANSRAPPNGYGPLFRTQPTTMCARICKLSSTRSCCPGANSAACKRKRPRRGAQFEFRFRNAAEVEFSAQPIDTPKLLTDLREYLESNPKQLDWQKLDIENIGYQLVQGNQAKYLGAETARWKLPLKSPADHFDALETVTSPLQKPGAYLLTAKVKEGNTANVIVWIADTAIVRKPLADKMLYYVADAASGEPVAGATLDLLGYQQIHDDCAAQPLPPRYPPLRRQHHGRRNRRSSRR